jgi:hypothetical protein
VLISLEAWERSEGWWRRGFTETAISTWTRVNDGFLEERTGSEWVSSWRLEDVLADTDRFTDEVARFFELDVSALDRSVFARPLHGYPDGAPRPLHAFEELPADLRALLDDTDLRRVAAAYGYELAGKAGSRWRRPRRGL